MKSLFCLERNTLCFFVEIKKKKILEQLIDKILEKKLKVFLVKNLEILLRTRTKNLDRISGVISHYKKKSLKNLKKFF